MLYKIISVFIHHSVHMKLVSLLSRSNYYNYTVFFILTRHVHTHTAKSFSCHHLWSETFYITQNAKKHETRKAVIKYYLKSILGSVLSRVHCILIGARLHRFSVICLSRLSCAYKNVEEVLAGGQTLS